MKPAGTRKLDVAVIGGGLAGNTLVRQLLRALPGLAMAQFEKTGESDYRVGESTVELASNYLVRRLGLSRYMYEEQLPKNGLRYFFDDPSKSTYIEEMSEIGSQSMPYHPSFQIDRGRIDQDLRRMNLEAGAEVHVGATVQKLALGEGGAPHRFEVRADGEDAALRGALAARRERPRRRRREGEGPARQGGLPQDQRGLGPLQRRRGPRRLRQRGVPRAHPPHDAHALDRPLLLRRLLDLVHPDQERRHQRRRRRRPAARRARHPHRGGLRRVPAPPSRGPRPPPECEAPRRAGLRPARLRHARATSTPTAGA